MKKLMIKRAGHKAIKYINYLKKNKIEFLLDKDNNLINLNDNNEIVECWLHKPIEIIVNGKKGIYYKGKRYFLEGSDKE